MRNDNRARNALRRVRRSAELFILSALLVTAGSCMTTRVAGAAAAAGTATASAAGEGPPTFDRAVTEYYRGSFDRSIRTLEEFVAAHPLEEQGRWQLVRELQEEGEYDPAAVQLRRLIELSKDPSSAVEELFVDLYLSGKLSEAGSLLPLPSESAHTLFYEGLLSMDLGQPVTAIARLRESLSRRAWHPVAWYFLGRLLSEQKDWAGATEAFNRALGQDPDLTMALVPLARAMLARNETEAAYRLLLRARHILPNEAWIEATIADLDRSYPRLAERRREERSRTERTLPAPRVGPVPAEAAASRPVRVGLAEGLRSIMIKTGGAFTIRSTTEGLALTYHGGAQQLLVMENDAGGVGLASPGQPPFLTWSAPVTLSYSDPRDTTLVFNLVTERGSFFASDQNLAYRGAIEIRPTSSGFTLVNILPLEEYLYSVLPSEMPASWPKAALEAQAVAARSYTLASLGSFAAHGYDLQGSVLSEAYGGVGSEQPSTTAAVNDTQSEVLLYDGRPLRAFYNANSGGYTENSSVVWGERAGMEAVPDILTPDRTSYLPLPSLAAWLHGDPRSFSAVSPFYSRAAYRWEKWVPVSEIARRIDREREIGTILSIVSHGRGMSGRVSAVEVTGTKGSIRIRGDAIRYLLGGLRSTLFVSRPKLGADGLPAYFIFVGGGWGHGVGMDQSGAAGMASAGFSYQAILAHYYPRARLEIYPQLASTHDRAGG